MGEGFTPTCMSAAELAAWREMAARVNSGGRRPCVDCPREFAEEAGECCNGIPASTEPRTEPRLLARKRLAARLWRARNLERVRAYDRSYRRRLTEAQLTAAYSIGTDQ